MAFPREPDDPYRSNPPTDEDIRRRAAANEARQRQSRFEDEFQPDLELTEGPASPGRMAAYAIAALLIVGAVLYGIAHTSTNTATTSSSPTNTTANTPAASPPPARNVQPGTTTGATPTAPAPTPAPQNNPAPAPSDSSTPAR